MILTDRHTGQENTARRSVTYVETSRFQITHADLDQSILKRFVVYTKVSSYRDLELKIHASIIGDRAAAAYEATMMKSDLSNSGTGNQHCFTLDLTNWIFDEMAAGAHLPVSIQIRVSRTCALRDRICRASQQEASFVILDTASKTERCAIQHERS